MKLDEAIADARLIASGVFPWNKPYGYSRPENAVIETLLEEVDRLGSILNARPPATDGAEPRVPESPLTEREALDWLLFRVTDVAAVSEGQFARALGVDRVEVRRRIDDGAAIDVRLREERVARARKEVPETLP